MAFTGNESEIITLTEATDWTAAYRAANPGAIKAHYFGKNQLMKVLNQENCAGTRAYYAVNSDGPQLILVGVDFAGKDMTTGIILDKALPCPSTCDPTSALY